jgi:hypothetical protein
MRDRRASDWAVDLGGRHATEGEVASALLAHDRLLLRQQSTESFHRLDFQLADSTGRAIELELKEKKQPLSDGWGLLRPEIESSNLFVLDELSLRKIVDAGHYAFLLVRDVPLDRWCLWSTGDLLVATSVRYVRTMHRGKVCQKGKLLLDITEAGAVVQTLEAALDILSRSVNEIDGWWTRGVPWPSLTS